MLSIVFDRSLNDPNEELETSFLAAYETTLKPHHNVIIRSVFMVAVKAAPYRKDFYMALGKDQEELMKDMISYFGSLKPIVAALVKFYLEFGMSFDKALIRFICYKSSSESHNFLLIFLILGNYEQLIAILPF